MSKILETLKKQHPKHASSYDSVQEELAKAFFGEPVKKTKNEKSPKSKSIIIGTLLLFIFIAFIFYTKFDINVTPKTKPEKDIFFIREGNLNSDSVKSISVEGDALRLKEPEETSFSVSNVKGRHGWANLEIVLKKPIDLNENVISYTARGKNGDEKLSLVLVDVNNRSYRTDSKSYTFLKKSWEKYIFNTKSLGNVIDVSKIAKIKFEFGGLTAGNYPSATLFIKDVSLEEKGKKWL